MLLVLLNIHVNYFHNFVLNYSYKLVFDGLNSKNLDRIQTKNTTNKY